MEELKSLALPYFLVHYSNVDTTESIMRVEVNAGVIRAVPIFYFSKDNHLYISDSVEWLIQNTGSKELNTLSVIELLGFGYVTSDRTLINGIKCLQAGEVLYVDKDNINVKTTYLYNSFEIQDMPSNELKKDFKLVSEDIFNDLISTLKGKTAVLPLSGGLDSRFIASMLYMGGVKDVITFSWGIPGCDDLKIGKAVAEKLGFEWHPVLYTEEAWQSLFNNDWFLRCLNYVSKYTSISGCASLPFLSYLQNNALFSNNLEDIVIIPGHTGDFISGGHIPSTLLNAENIEDIAYCILNKHYTLRGSSVNPQIWEEIKHQVLIYNELNQPKEELFRIFELWEWRERQVKFIANANRYYEFIGINWTMPFWDRRYVEFWDKVPLSLKYNKKLYKEYLGENIFKELDITYQQRKRKITYNFFVKIIRKNVVISNLIKKLLKTNIISSLRTHNTFGFDFALPLLDKKAQKEYNESYKKVNDFINEHFSDSNSCNNPYSYLSKFMLTVAFDNLNIYKGR